MFSSTNRPVIAEFKFLVTIFYKESVVWSAQWKGMEVPTEEHAPNGIESLFDWGTRRDWRAQVLVCLKGKYCEFDFIIEADDPYWFDDNYSRVDFESHLYDLRFSIFKYDTPPAQ